MIRRLLIAAIRALPVRDRAQWRHYAFQHVAQDVLTREIASRRKPGRLVGTERGVGA